MLRYCEDYDVQVFDRIEARVDGQTVNAIITAIHPRKGTVRIRYEDPMQVAKMTGEPLKHSATVPISACDLIARDG